MWIDRLTSSPTGRALELATQFAEARHQVLAENLANVDTPNYQTQRLDAQSFETSLREALDRANETGTDTLELRGNEQFATDAQGRAKARPVLEPAQNALFHDGTNVRLEKLIADSNENAISYDLAMNLLKNRLDLLLRAIRGRTT